MKNLLPTSLAAALAASLLAIAQTTPAASSTWNGTVSAAWTNAANWSPDIPAPGDDVVIADTTGAGNSLSLTDSRVIGSLLFGTTGTRTTAFQITNSVAANSLTFNSGFTANGNLATVVEFFRVPVVIANDQTWTVAGPIGSATGDAGIRFRERSAGVQNRLTLDGTLIKSGSGQLSLVGITNFGGNFVINQGALKLNAGGSTRLTLTGPGSITVNSGGWLMLSRNSGTFDVTRPFVLNNGATIQYGSGAATITPFGSPITWNGTVNLALLHNGITTNSYTNSWSGNATINITSGNANAVTLSLDADNSTLAGTVNNQANNARLRFTTANSASPNATWTLGHAAAVLEAYGPANVHLGALAGTAGIVRNSNPAGLPATVTVGALNSDTQFGGALVDDAGQLGLIKTGSGALTLTGNNTYSGGCAVNSGAVLLQGTAANAGSGLVNVAGGARFGGSGSAIGGATVQHNGTLLASGGTGSPALNVGPLVLGTTAGDFTTNAINVYLGGKVVATSGLTVNGKSIINVSGAAPAVGTYDLLQHNGSIGGAGFGGFQLGALPYGVLAHLQNGATAVQLVVDAITIEPSVWTGAATGTWNLNNTLDWKGATSGNPQPFHDQDVTRFDDSASVFTVTVATNVTPSSMTFSGASTYTLAGSGNIIGLAALAKDGAGTLIVANSNTFSGGTFITNGTVQLGNGGTNGHLAGPIQNSASLTFNRTDALTVPGVISGIGNVEQKGLGRTTMGGANTYEGTTAITVGTLAAGTGTAFGSTNVGVTVASGSTLDVNSQALGMEPVTATGAGVDQAGAIVNNGAGDQQSALRFVTLTGDTTFGGLRRWDIRNPSAGTDLTGGTHAYLHGNGHKLTKTGSNVVAFIQLGDTGLGAIDLQAGTLTISRSTQLGVPSAPLTLWPGAAAQFHRLNEYMVNPFTKVMSLTNATLGVEASGLTNDLTGAITLNGSNVVTAPASTGLILRGAVGGPGSLNHLGPSVLIIAGTANHAGGTAINGGILQVDGSVSASAGVTFTGSGTLAGIGSVGGLVTVPSGSTLAPGNDDPVTTGIGTLSLGSLVLQTGSTLRGKVNTDYTSNDRVNLTTSVTYGGTLVITNTGYSPYAPGQAFKFFQAASYSGTFAGIVPTTPGLGLLWDTNTLTSDGTVRVIVQPNPRPLRVLSAGSLVPTKLNVIFDTEVEVGSATDPNNYVVSTGQGIFYVTMVSTTNAEVNLTSPLAPGAYSVQVRNVKDMAYIPNVVATTNVASLSWAFLDTANVIIPQNLAFAFGPQIKVYGSGSDIFGSADQFEFVYRGVTNDFDVSVRLETQLPTDPSAKAGIMAREFDLNAPGVILADQRNAFVFGFPPAPGRELNVFSFRDTVGGATGTTGIRPETSYTNNWLRLKRVGDAFFAYSGTNNLDWTLLSSLETSTNAAGAFNKAMYIGLAVTSHTTGATNEAIFSSFGPARERPALSVSRSVNNVVLTWPASGLGWTLQASPALTAPDANWTTVPGSTAVTTVTLPISAGNRFFRLIQ